MFRATTFDLVIIDQAVRGYSRFGLPAVPSVGVNHGRGLDYLQLADHFSPIYALLTPLYWVADRPQTLIYAQAALFAAAIPSLWLFTRRALGIAPAYLVSVAYAISWPIVQAARFDVHEVMFVPVLTAVLVERVQAGRMRAAWVALIGLLLVKEDMGLFVIGFGAYLAITGRRTHGLAAIAVGALWTGLVRSLFIPLLGGDSSDFWAYGQIGKTIPDVLLTIFTSPVHTLALLVDETKLNTMILLAWVVLFTCLLSPLTLAAVPLVLERMLSDRPFWWAADYQYNAFVVVILFCAGVDGAARLRRRFANVDVSMLWSVGVLVAALTLIPRFPLYQLIRPDFYTMTPRVEAAYEAVSTVPDGVTVDAADTAGPALTSRTTVLLWDGNQHNAPWVVADITDPQWPISNPDRQRQIAQDLVDQQGYEMVYQKEGWVVLHRP
ncbi:DUF2079 domain-containing protein [Streptosporangiaceae bacterium NEAU-GS5]|nr:DUF2079 domain-containing protein [Streptosporangiaceae bacterium NEAU-GS5]